MANNRKYTKRFSMGSDLWECTACNRINIMGRKCKCGMDYGKVLAEKYSSEDSEEKKARKKPRKPYQPVKETEFLQSFFKPIKENEK